MLLFRRCWVSFDTMLEIVENVFLLWSSKCVILWNLIYPENSGFKAGPTASAVLKYLPCWEGRGGTFDWREAALCCPELTKAFCIETFSTWLCKCGTYRRKTTSRVKYQEVLQVAVILCGFFSPLSLPCFLSPAGDGFAQCTHCVFHSRMLCQTESLHCWLFHAV